MLFRSFSVSPSNLGNLMNMVHPPKTFEILSPCNPVVEKWVILAHPLNISTPLSHPDFEILVMLAHPISPNISSFLTLIFPQKRGRKTPTLCIIFTIIVFVPTTLFTVYPRVLTSFVMKNTRD